MACIMISRYIFRLCGYGLFALLAAPSLVRATQNVCCKFETDTPPVWENSITLPLPAVDNSCHWHARFPGAITFAGTDRLVAAFYSDCYTADGQTLVHSHESLVAIDSHTGRLLTQASWRDLSVNGPGGNAVQIFSVNESRILFRAGRFLKLCSLDLKEIHSRYLATMSPRERWDVYLSPGGTVGVLKHSRPNETQTEEQWFSTDTLEPIQTDLAPAYSSYIAVTDDKVYYHPNKAQHNGKSLPVHVRKRGEPLGQPLCELCNGIPRQVMPNGLLFLVRESPAISFWLVNPSGEIVYRGSYGKAIDNIIDVTFSSASDRLAFSFGHLENKLFNHSGTDRLVVFDMKGMKESFHLKIKTFPEKDDAIESWIGPKVALSPDGRHFAILEGFRLKLFSTGGQQ
jgi:hypothetical protein